MSFFLALDVGGTKTDYVLADETRTLARVRTGTIKRLRADAATAATRLDEALAELSAQTGVAMTGIACTCVGTAGESVPLVSQWLTEAITARVPGKLILLGDVEIALDAAFHGGPGVLVLAGTGSNIAGRSAAGRLTTAGGWGPAIGDQGSGYRIGLQALRAAFLARDEGKPTSLLDAALAHWGLASIEELVEFANGQPEPDFSQLTEPVLHCAQQGDAVANAVLKKAGEDLGWLVRLVLRRLLAGPVSVYTPPPIAFAGSIMEKVHPVREALIASVREEFPAVETRDGVIDPIEGALWRARTSL